MKSKYSSKYISKPAGIIMTLVILLFVVMILQMIILGVVSICSQDLLGIAKQEQAELVLTPDEQIQKRISESQHEFLPNGTVHLVYTPEDQIARSDERKIEIYDKNDDLLWTGKKKDNPYHYLLWPTYVQNLSADSFEAMKAISPMFSETLTVTVTSDDRKITQRWRYERNKKYFTGFDFNGFIIGYAGSNGFKRSEDDVIDFGDFKNMCAWSPSESYDPILLWESKKGLYQISFTNSTIQFLNDNQELNIEKYQMNNWRQINVKYADQRPALLLSAKNGAHKLLLQDPRETLSFNTPQEWFLKSLRFSVHQDNIFLKHSVTEGEPSPDNRVLWRKWQEENRLKSKKRHSDLYHVDDSGNIHLVNSFNWETLPRQITPAEEKYETRMEKAMNCLTTLSPALYELLHFCFYEKLFTLRYYGRDVTLVTASAIIIHQHPKYLTANICITLILICAALWHGWPRRTSYIRLILWLVFVGLFNLAGFLTYMALNHTPIIRCSECGKKRGLERSDCPACMAELPVPQKRSTDLIMANPS